MNTGPAQELRLVEHLRKQGYRDIIHREEIIKKELNLPPHCKCADVVAFFPTKADPLKVIVAESKGTDIPKSLKQLGNTAVGLFEMFDGAVHQMRLLLYVKQLKTLPVGLSPGNGYLADPTPIPKHYRLQNATSQNISLAVAECEMNAPFNRWTFRLKHIVIEVVVEQ